MSRLSDEVWHLLREAGWYEGRRISTRPFVDANAAAGCRWSAAAESFMREFGDLQLRFLRHDGSVSTLHFRAQQALGHPQALRTRQDYLQRRGLLDVVVIGQAYEEDLVLLLDERGRVYGGGCDECLYLIGPDGPAAITTLCLDLPFQQL